MKYYGPAIFSLSVGCLLAVLLIIFGIIVVIYGMPERMSRSRSRQHPVIGVFLIEYWMWLISPIEKFFLRFKVSPTSITILSLFFHVVGGVFIAIGRFTAGGWLFLAGATFDILDGRIAKLTNSASKVGAYLDSVLDRYGEMAMLLGFGYYYYKLHHWGLLLAAVTAVGAVMVSYTRSRAESLGASAKRGFMQRPERAFFIGVVTSGDCFVTCFVEKGVTNPVHWPVIVVLLFVGISANITALQRIFISIKELREGKSMEEAGSMGSR